MHLGHLHCTVLSLVADQETCAIVDLLGETVMFVTFNYAVHL